VTLGIPTPYFWYGVAILCSAVSLVCVFVAWYRHVAALALLGERWVNNCGTLEKAVQLCGRYEATIDRRIGCALATVEAEEIARDDALGEQMLRDALREPPPAVVRIHNGPRTGDPFEKLLEQIRGEIGPTVLTFSGPDVPCCSRATPHPEDTQ
jgi:hypothetical protein